MFSSFCFVAFFLFFSFDCLLFDFLNWIFKAIINIFHGSKEFYMPSILLSNAIYLYFFVKFCCVKSVIDLIYWIKYFYFFCQWNNLDCDRWTIKIIYKTICIIRDLIRTVTYINPFTLFTLWMLSNVMGFSIFCKCS